jgi:hypothetical protein
VAEDVVDRVEERLSDEETLAEALDAGFRDLDRLQPALAGLLAERVASRKDELAQSLGFFLFVAIFLVFREAFPTRLTEVDAEAVAAAVDSLEADEALRSDDPNEVIDSDDVVAMNQPAVLRFVQEHLQEALDVMEDEADLDALDEVYRALLVEVIALSHAVTPPARHDAGPAGTDEILA